MEGECCESLAAADHGGAKVGSEAGIEAGSGLGREVVIEVGVDGCFTGKAMGQSITAWITLAVLVVRSPCH